MPGPLLTLPGLVTDEELLPLSPLPLTPGPVLSADEDEEVGYDFDELDELAHAYAVTIHRSQGSEYPAVVIPVTTGAWMMLQRNLLYTAVTRAKRCHFSARWPTPSAHLSVKWGTVVVVRAPRRRGKTVGEGMT